MKHLILISILLCLFIFIFPLLCLKSKNTPSSHHHRFFVLSNHEGKNLLRTTDRLWWIHLSPSHEHDVISSIFLAKFEWHLYLIRCIYLNFKLRFRLFREQSSIYYYFIYRRLQRKSVLIDYYFIIRVKF